MRIERIKILDFKKIENLELEFGNITKIEESNAYGKTTILDAVAFCLFGVNSKNEAKFAWQPNYKEEFAMNLEVQTDLGLFTKIFKRNLDPNLKSGFREEWQFFFNGEEITSITKYHEMVLGKIGVSTRNEAMSYLFPAHFMTNVDKKSQTKLFGNLLKDVSTVNILTKIEDSIPDKIMFKEFEDRLLAGEKASSIQESSLLQAKEFSVKEIADLESKIKYINSWLADNNVDKNDDHDSLQQQLDEAKTKIDENNKIIKNNNTIKRLKSDIEIIKDKIEAKKGNKINTNDSEISSLKAQIQSLENKNITNSKDMLSLKEQVIETHCPTCGADIEESKLGDARANLEIQVNAKKEKGIQFEKEIENIEEKIEELEKNNELVISDKSGLAKLVEDLESNELGLSQQGEIKPEIDIFQENLSVEKISKVLGLTLEIENKKKELIEFDKKIKIIESKSEENLKLSEVAKIFIMKKAQMAQEVINKEFKFVSVVLTRLQANGVLKETFDLVDRNSNTATKDTNDGHLIRGQIELCSKLQEYNGINFPMLIDNAEQVDDMEFVKNFTNQFIYTKVKAN